ncbi:MAG: hypothetical protein CVV25_10745 [Ignavibacteriae bacterium HGW-Ignavibacteriae-4]|jgi:hypothetical protein|nr:MAG: hypothetical protein CVV25_10745 [Ignavibacteriae bacterium HGW-Ignavibacteriae-4]
MKKIVIVFVILIISLELFLNQSLHSKPCFDIHEMIKYSNVYRENLAFNKNLITKGETFEIYEDYIYMKDSESRILERIKNDPSNSIRKEIGLDTAELKFVSYFELYELSKALDTNSIIDCLLFKIHYKDYYILAEVNFVGISERNTLYGKISSLINYSDGDGFDISYNYSTIIYYLFKCDPKDGLIYIDSHKEIQFP